MFVGDDVLYHLNYVTDSHLEPWPHCIMAGLYCLLGDAFIVILCRRVFVWYMSMNHVHAVSEEAKRGHQILWMWKGCHMGAGSSVRALTTENSL